MSGTKYYLTTKRTCAKCQGEGDKLLSSAARVLRGPCEFCSGSGTIKAEQEVKLQSVGEGEFVISGRWVSKEEPEFFYDRQQV